MLKTFTKQSYKFLSILIVISIFFSLVNLFTDNVNLNEINSVDELTNNQEINCNQHYWTLKNKIDDLVKYVYDDVPEQLHPIAKFSLEAHLIKLIGENKVKREKEFYKLN